MEQIILILSHCFPIQAICFYLFFETNCCNTVIEPSFPSACVPYVVKDESYEEIALRKKHLYNRKYKIKKHKKLTDAERKQQLAEIDKELALLSAKVKYLNREEAVREYRRKKEEETK